MFKMLIKGDVVYGFKGSPLRQKAEFCIYVEDSTKKEDQSLDDFLRALIRSYLKADFYDAFEITQLHYTVVNTYVLKWKELYGNSENDTE